MTREQLKEARLNAGFTQTELANHLGLSMYGYQRMEYGQTPIPKYVKIIYRLGKFIKF